ncbi:hypothetical protein ACP4OV_011347 [Aristida adscensionis]
MEVLRDKTGKKEAAVCYMDAPLPYAIEDSYGGCFFDDDVDLAQVLQDQEILYQLIQGNNGSGSSRTHSAPSSSYSHDRTSNKRKPSGVANYELQLSVDEALARELQEMESQLANTSLNDNNGRKLTTSSASDSGNSSTGRPPQVVEEDAIDPDNMTYEELQQLGEAIGTESKGLPERVIALLPTSTYKTGIFSRKEKHEECVICCMAYKSRDRLTKLPCTHQYHQTCVTKWLQINKRYALFAIRRFLTRKMDIADLSDGYMMDSETAAPLTLYMLEGMLSSQKSTARTKALDLILNHGVHAHLLEPMVIEVAPVIDKSYLSNEYGSSTDEPRPAEPEEGNKISPAIHQFESWILKIHFEVLLLLVQMEERQEIVWASALSCLFYFVCDGGKIIRSRQGGLDIRVVKTLLEISVEHSWAKVVHSKLICMLTNMLYQVSDATQNGVLETHFIPERIDLLGGIDYICLEYSRANSREEKRDLFFVIFDHVVHQINEACLAGGISTYTYDDAQPLASLLAFADAPEAFYISVKHGVEGVGDMLRKAISAALSQSAEYDQLNVLLDKLSFAVIDIMNSALLLVVQNNETDHINILKMCDMLFSQLCLRIPCTNALHLGGLQSLGQLFGCTTKSESHLENLASHQNVGSKNICRRAAVMILH